MTRHTGRPFKVESVTPIAGGSPWRALSIDNTRTGTPKRIFAKVGSETHLRIFAAEADGLTRLRAATATLRVPTVIACDTLDAADGEGDEGAETLQAVLLLEWIDLAPLSPPAAALLGHSLADLHSTRGERFGLDRDNFIGATPQRNTQDDDWVRFWQHHRLQPQLALCAKHRYPSRMIDRGERLLADCGAFFRDYRPVPSLLHGDLWAGNVAQDELGLPVIYDPAVYHGDREADIAMTELFGRFPTDFYAAYHNAWPLDVGYGVRKHFYNLYHVLNHANLFAGDYVRRGETMIESLLAEL
ncbi:MAG: fructosamine kinase family protein [Betaproteobacteria bacterium]|nr:fructosamine kinase family protein [Betaproteobacteria bacterium]